MKWAIWIRDRIWKGGRERERGEEWRKGDTPPHPPSSDSSTIIEFGWIGDRWQGGTLRWSLVRGFKIWNQLSFLSANPNLGGKRKSIKEIKSWRSNYTVIISMSFFTSTSVCVHVFKSWTVNISTWLQCCVCTHPWQLTGIYTIYLPEYMYIYRENNMCFHHS